MRWSKAWFTLVALAGALGVAGAVLAPLLVQRDIDNQIAARLASAAAGADAQVQLHARRWIDAAAHAALDAQLAEALDHSSTNTANLELLHRTAQARLATFQAEWKAWQVTAVDAHGRVLARVGAAEERWKDDLSAALLVTEALKGFRLDDTWLIEGRLLKVVAAPVVVRERYAGALLVALDLGADLAQPLADKLGTEVVLVANGRVAGRSAGAPSIEVALPQLDPKAAQKAGGSKPVPLATPTGGKVLLPATIAGSMGPALVVVVADRPLLATPSALKARLLGQLQGPSGAIPWVDLAPVLAGLLAALLLGYFLMGREQSAPLDALHDAAQAVSRGEAQRIDEARITGRAAAIARYINAALDRLRAVGVRLPSLEVQQGPLALPVSSTGPQRPVGVAPAAPEAGGPISLPPLPASLPPLEPPAGGSPRAAAALPPLTAPAAGAPSTAPVVPAVYATPAYKPGAGPLRPMGPPGYSPDGPPSARGAAVLGNLDETEPAAGPELRANAAAMGGSALGPTALGSPALAASAFGAGAGAAAYARSSQTNLAAVAGRAGALPAPPPLAAGRASSPGLFPPAGPASSSPAASASIAPPPVDPVEADFHAVFQDFLDTRQRCGEPVEGLTFEKFAAKLRGNREQLMTRYGCKGVKFQVYVKDGKAALKATPVN